MALPMALPTQGGGGNLPMEGEKTVTVWATAMATNPAALVPVLWIKATTLTIFFRNLATSGHPHLILGYHAK